MVSSPLKSTEKLSLYEQDFYLWVETTVNQLKNGELSAVDLENLIEEIEAIAHREKQALESNLIIV